MTEQALAIAKTDPALNLAQRLRIVADYLDRYAFNFSRTVRDGADTLDTLTAELAEARAELRRLNERLDLELDAYAKDSDIGAANARAEAAESKIALLTKERDEAREALTNVRDYLEIERAKLGNIDGYNYSSGEEYGLCRAIFALDAALAAHGRGTGV